MTDGEKLDLLLGAIHPDISVVCCPCSLLNWYYYKGRGHSQKRSEAFRWWFDKLREVCPCEDCSAGMKARQHVACWRRMLDAPAAEIWFNIADHDPETGQKWDRAKC